MSKHITILPEEAADRLAIRELVDEYAHYADRRDAKAQMALFTPGTHFVVYMNAKDTTPTQELHSRSARYRWTVTVPASCGSALVTRGNRAVDVLTQENGLVT